MIYYAALSDEVIRNAQQYDLAIVHPLRGNATAEQIAQIQAGKDPSTNEDDVLVLCYLSIGEDTRTFGLSDEQLRNDPGQRFTRDGTGPRTDPRGPDASGQALRDIDPVGVVSSGGSGFAPYYLDDNDYDGSPDRNNNFGVAFVNAGHPAWFEEVNNMRSATDGVPGIKELLTDDTSENQLGLNCDGLFLDTLDTAAPNSFTDETSPNQTEFEWTAFGFTAFIQRLRAAYPDKLILQNRGLFFFNPVFAHYEVNPRSLVDFVLFESYQLDSSSDQTANAYFAADNKHVFRPRLMAEAQRDDGFQVLSLGYAEGPANQITPDSLLEPDNEQAIGFDLLIQDIVQAEQLSGFRHYLTNARVELANDFVRSNAPATDTTAPQWTSTFNPTNNSFPTPPVAVQARAGIQRVLPGPGIGEVTVQWDVALDFNPVQYVLYYQTSPFDFTDPDLGQATELTLSGLPSAAYGRAELSESPANEMIISGLGADATYHFLIRARDSLGNEEKNEVVLTESPLAALPQHEITIDGLTEDWDRVPVAHADPADATIAAGPDWREIRITNDETHLFIYVSLETPSLLNSRFNIYIDTDQNPSTGYTSGSLSGLGADYLIQARTLYGLQTGSAFQVTPIGAIATSDETGNRVIELAVPLAQLGVVNVGQAVGLTFVNDASPGDFAPDLGTPLVVNLALPGSN
jgi:hypothetical protein